MLVPEIKGVTFLGDVHLGRKFIEGVPLHRRGEREEAVWKQFENELKGCTSGIHIQVGDLFDSFDVDNATLLRAAEIYLSAARLNTNTTYIVIRGNHDASRNTNKVSSFDLFGLIVKDRVHVVSTPHVLTHQPGGQTIGLMPWDPFSSAEEQAQRLETYEGKLDFVVCHCDLESYGGSTYNVLPYDTLSKVTDVVVTGHDHIRRDFQHGSLHVYVTGSMQPYSHGEDPNHTLYKTVTVQELAAMPPEEIKNSYIRLALYPGDVPPEPPDALGFSIKVMGLKSLDDEAPDINVGFESFDTANLFKQVMEELKVSPAIISEALEKFTEAMNA